MNDLSMHKAVMALLLGGLATAASGAQTTTASASLVNFRVTVVDLDLNDGIAAGVFPVCDPMAEAVSAFVATPREELRDSDYSQHYFFWLAAEAHARLNGAIANAAIARNSMFANGSAPADQFRFTAQAVQQAGWDYTILPNTRLIFTGDAAVMSTGVAAGSYLGGGVSFSLVSRQDFSALGSFSLPLVANQSATQPMHVSVSTGAEPWTGHYFLSTNVEFHPGLAASMAPIPEPQTYALMLSGLALFGLAGVRRWRSARSSI
jgi:hypothetical protein